MNYRMLPMDPNELTALPVTLEDAHKEIRELQRIMYSERAAWWTKYEKALLNHKAAVGEVKSYKKQALEAEKELAKIKMKLSALPFDIDSL